ncbi:spore germination GerPB [Tumebacillus sp. BK434]|uniref:spore germination protein GerPB n=1 Tax=Tumebacillus sp. BK434 TaxID=2512169 RepID=UPI001044949B|nr:spore germination protein GerPB [Tumebacillus sp. BK434]TCP55666.1 spore germination GerPB [Tumebacillus sp. BK434]
MRVNQTIRIGSLTVTGMSNSSIVQIGTSGAIKARSEQITEQITQQQADQTVEDKIHQEIEPMLNAEGLPVSPEKQRPKRPPVPLQGEA